MRCKTKQKGRQDARQKKWGDKTQKEKNGAMRCETEKKWGDETRDKKNREVRCETKKWGDKTQDRKKMGRQDAR